MPDQPLRSSKSTFDLASTRLSDSAEDPQDFSSIGDEGRVGGRW